MQTESLILQRKISQDRSDLAEAQAAVPRIDGALAALAARRPANQTEAAVLIKQAGALQKQRAKAINTIRRLSRTIPSMEAAVKQIEQVAHLGSQLHKSARFHLRLSATTGSRETTLVQIGKAPR